MLVQTDRYVKFILTVIAVLLVLLLFKPQLQNILTPTPAHAQTRIEGIVDDEGRRLFLTNVIVRNLPENAIPIVPTDKIKIVWDEPMPVYIVEKKGQ